MTNEKMIYDITMLYNQLICNELQLNKIDEEIKQKGIKPKQIENPDNYFIASNYFFLINHIYLDRLNEEEKIKLETCISEYKKGNKQYNQELYSFLKQNMLKLLLPETNERYMYYGGTGFEYMAPSDSIVLGFHYIRFEEGFIEEQDEIKERFINDKLNYIQEQLGPNKNMKVAVIKYDNRVRNFSKNL